jgi:hypothetical protein
MTKPSASLQTFKSTPTTGDMPMEKCKYRVLLYGMAMAGFDNFASAKDFVQNSRGDGFMVTLWENDGKHLKHIDVEANYG